MLDTQELPKAVLELEGLLFYLKLQEHKLKSVFEVADLAEMDDLDEFLFMPTFVS